MNRLSVAFYTEAGNKRGLGHLIRSYSIYEKFKNSSIKASFFVDSDIDFSYKFNDITCFKWADFRIVGKYDIIFIDSYEADILIYEKVSNSCKLAVFIDDYCRLDYPKGVILNFAPDAQEQFFKLKETKHTHLLGLNYIPIRKQFLNTIPSKQKQIFIMLGGSDTANLASTIINLLEDINIKKIIVVNNKQLVESLNKYKNIKALYQPTDKELAENMSNSSLAISTASMGVYELAYFKVPTIIIAVTKNQEEGAQQLINHHLAIAYISIKNKHWKNNMMKEVSTLYLQNYLTIKSIDGQGTQRIFDRIKQLADK